jgi:hypothetical protein
MTPSQEQEKQINLSLMILNFKINALRASLSEDQDSKYWQSIEESKKTLLTLLDKPLSQKEIDEAINSLDM